MFAIVVAFAVASNYNVNQRGNNINGSVAYERFGHSVALAANGNVLAVGNNEIGNSKTRLTLLRFENDDWHEFENILGEGPSFGHSISLSEDGLVVAATTPDYNYFTINEFYTNYTHANSFGFTYDASSISVSADGTTFAVGAPGNFSTIGTVQVWSKNATNGFWEVNAELQGQNGSWFGYSVSLSGDGSRLAVGAKFYTLSSMFDYTERAGSVTIYNFNGAAWIPQISKIGQENDLFGESVSLSRDGSIFAASGITAGQGVGYVKVFKLIDSTWEQIGSSIYEKEVSSYFGSSLTLSPDGIDLVVGASGGGAGQVYFFSYDGNTWNEVYTINGSTNSDQFGYSVALSTTAIPSCKYTVAIGARLNDDNGDDAGQTRVYDVCVSSTDDDDDSDLTLILAITIPVVLLAIVLIVRQCLPEYWPQSLRANFVGL